MPAVRTEGADVTYRVQGGGEPLILVAGTGYAGATWHPDLVSALARDHAVVTFDHRGTGESTGSAAIYSTELLARDALAVLAALGAGPAHVAGHSMGGRVAQWMAIQRPDAVRSLVLASTGAGLPTRIDAASVGIATATVLGLIEKGYAGLVADAQRRTFFTDAYAQAQPAMVDWLFTAFWQARPPIAEYLKHVQARQAHCARDHIAGIGAPTLVMVGGLDTHVGGTGSHLDQSVELNELISSSELTILPGLKHGVFWEGMEECVTLLRAWTHKQRN